MSKIFNFLVEAWFWFLLFLSPVFGFGLLGVILLLAFELPILILYLLLFAGAITGIFLAEYVRGKYGCSNFWSRIMATPDIDPYDEKKKDKDEG